MKKIFLTPYVVGLCLCVSLLASTALGQTKSISLEAQKERDCILSLLTLAFVHNDWQTANTAQPRGHNIGSVLVNENGIPVFWTRNAIKLLHNSTQHGEVRLATRYLSNVLPDKYMPKGYVLYTSLEPCAMCTGMLSMVKTKRVVYVQQDPEFGRVPEALKSIDYPRLYTVATPSDMEQKKKLDDGWSTFKAKGGTSITEYLLTPDAKQIYQSAADSLNTYDLKYANENTSVLTAAKLLAQSALPELGIAAGSSQKMWNVNFSPTLFIEYLDWNDTKNIAQIVGDSFYICTNGNCGLSDEIQYKDGNVYWSATLANGTFTLKQRDSGTTVKDRFLIYQGWDGVINQGAVQDILLPD